MLKFISLSLSGKKKYPPITFEYSQEEIAAKAGIKVSSCISPTNKQNAKLLTVYSFCDSIPNNILTYNSERLMARVEVAATWLCYRFDFLVVEFCQNVSTCRRT